METIGTAADSLAAIARHFSARRIPAPAAPTVGTTGDLAAALAPAPPAPAAPAPVETTADLEV